MKILFSARLRELRAERGLSQKEVAEALQTTQRKISYWEMGQTEPDLASLWRLSEYFGVSIDFLIGKSDF